MKTLLTLLLTIPLSGCWFVFIPGSVIQAVTDGITGSEGAHCISAGARVGDTVSMPGGGRATVKSVSGTSVRCNDPSVPIRALLTF